jgi:hypothetical protein
MYTPKKLIANKLYRLLSFLHLTCKEFDNISRFIKEKEIKMSVRGFAVETKQYVEELKSQIKTLSPKNISPINNKEEIKGKLTRKKNISDKKIIEVCCSAEAYFEKEYRILLNEYFPYTGLRDMLTYQLNGIKSAFMQLKLLNSVMPAEAILSKELF